MLNDEKRIGSKSTSDLSKNGVSKPSIELEDFYSLLDPKVVEKIKQTSEEKRNRIMNDIKQYEYELDGARKILDLLK